MVDRRTILQDGSDVATVEAVEIPPPDASLPQVIEHPHLLSEFRPEFYDVGPGVRGAAEVESKKFQSIWIPPASKAAVVLHPLGGLMTST